MSLSPTDSVFDCYKADMPDFAMEAGLFCVLNLWLYAVATITEQINSLQVL